MLLFWIVALLGQDYRYHLYIAILPGRHPFATSTRFRQRKTFGPWVVVVRDIFNSEGRPPVEHLYQYSSAGGLLPLERLSCGYMQFSGLTWLLFSNYKTTVE